MAWLLQPHDYRQVLIPNFYRVDYGRVGAYKGMGRLGQYSYCSDVSCSGNIGPAAPGDITALPLGYASTPAVTSAINAPLIPAQTVGQWMQANSGMLAIGAVLFVVLAAGRR